VNPSLTVKVRFHGELFILISHLLVTLAKLGARAGLGALVAESLAVKHQLVIMKRAQRRAPNLTSWDRLALGGCALLVPPKGQSKMAVILKPSTLLCFHHALVKRFHRWLANLRVLEVDEIKAIPCTPRSHAFVERLIGRYGASTSIGPYFGTKAILSGSSKITRPITTNTGVTAGWPELAGSTERRAPTANRNT
jgi:hypothetical protein